MNCKHYGFDLGSIFRLEWCSGKLRIEYWIQCELVVVKYNYITEHPFGFLPLLENPEYLLSFSLAILRPQLSKATEVSMSVSVTAKPLMLVTTSEF